MIRHTVLFKLQDFDTEEAKLNKLNELKSALESLPAKIDVVKGLVVGLNVNPAEKFDLALVVDVDSLEALALYNTHPDHVAVGKLLRPVLESRSCVDYEI
ncbi:Dabb family protein [Saccharicrinis fermentans]|uniref:Stress responsive A/B barrel domain protein n=1 Tax=Saccharicrinis fermentans DSM 9555 = JCM 21142 TaxID=869213 RepID=W7Y1D1_9BACT|nr:Dabb family protein [Saccharicrinis fermentans]GAF01767.1 stress responsive A/B barrel domain protein [Saccharicrinis fermentans DSM 9555 = JCM 21142]